jgi:hypothetical protein
MFWIFTDAIYSFSIIQPREPVEWSRLLRAGYRYQWGSIAYGAASIFLSMSGFAGIHSGIVAPLTVLHGFQLCGVLFVAVFGHVVWSAHERNQIGMEARAAAIANAERLASSH